MFGMSVVKMEEITELINKAVKEATDSLTEKFKKANDSVMAELDALKAENTHLKDRITNMERAVEKK